MSIPVNGCSPLPTWQITALNSGSSSTAGTASIRLDNGFRLDIDESRSQIRIVNTNNGETTTIWGDPHVDWNGAAGEEGRFFGNMSFVLADDTKITINTVPANASRSAWLAENVVVTKGDQSLIIDGIAQTTRGDLRVWQGMNGQALDRLVGDGRLTVHENAHGVGWTTEQGGNRLVSQADFDRTRVGAGEPNGHDLGRQLQALFHGGTGTAAATCAPATVKPGCPPTTIQPNCPPTTVAPTCPPKASPALAEARALSHTLAGLQAKFDLGEINRLNGQSGWEGRMQYLYKQINGWTVVNRSGGWFVTADDGTWGGASRVGANVNSDAAGSQMRFSQLRAESPRQFNWVESEIESYFGYDSTRNAAAFATDEALAASDNRFWHNASGTRGFLQQLRGDLMKAEQLLGDPCVQADACLAGDLRRQIACLKEVGKGLFRMSDNQPTPYIVDFAGNGIATGDQYLQVGGNGPATQWVKADENTDDAVLVFDRNDDGKVSGFEELLAARAEDAATGQAALGQLDDNADGVVDARDAAFASLRLWFDRNGNGTVDAGEMKALSDLAVKAFRVAWEANLDPTAATGFRTDANGNTHRYSTTVTLDQGRQATMTDVFFNAAG
jgi:hypothetical protein